jgi:hypothetical protein
VNILATSVAVVTRKRDQSIYDLTEKTKNGSYDCPESWVGSWRRVQAVTTSLKVNSGQFIAE